MPATGISRRSDRHRSTSYCCAPRKIRWPSANQSSRSAVSMISGGRPRRRIAADRGGDLPGGGGQLGAVLDHVADLPQGQVQRGLDPLRPLGVGDPVDQQVHPGLVDDALRAVRGQHLAAGAEHVDQPAVGVAADVQDRVQHAVHDDTGGGQRADHRVDQVRHVVVDQVDHGRLGRPVVAGDLRVEHPDPRHAGLADLGQPAVGPDDARARRRACSAGPRRRRAGSTGRSGCEVGMLGDRGGDRVAVVLERRRHRCIELDGAPHRSLRHHRTPCVRSATLRRGFEPSPPGSLAPKGPEQGLCARQDREQALSRSRHDHSAVLRGGSAQVSRGSACGG